MSTTYTYKGYIIERGAYQCTTDDRLDRWYAQPVDRDFIDRRGPGFATMREAKAAINEHLSWARSTRETR